MCMRSVHSTEHSLSRNLYTVQCVPIDVAAAAWCGDVHASHGGGVCTLSPRDTTFALWLVPVGTAVSALCHPNTETLRTE